MRVLNAAPRDRPLRICDIGCGVGGVLAAIDELLGKKGIEVELTGYDIAPLAIEGARERWSDRSNITFECCDVLSLDRLNYDLCLLMDVLEHLEDPVCFLRELRGRGIVEFAIHLPLENNWISIMRGKTDSRRSPVGHLHFFDTHSALSMLERAGLTVAKWVYTPELDLDVRLHRTLPSMLAYVPRRALLATWPALAVHTIGGAAMMARCIPCEERRT